MAQRKRQSCSAPIVIKRLAFVFPNATDIPRVRSAGAIRRSSSLNARTVFGHCAEIRTRRGTSLVNSSSISVGESFQSVLNPPSSALSIKARASGESSIDALAAARRLSP